MADLDEKEDDTLVALESLTRRLDYSEQSWIEIKVTLEKLKTWAMTQENRYF